MQKSNLFISFSNIKGVSLTPKKEYNANDIIIYTISLPDFINLSTDLSRLLSFNELSRAERYYKEIDKNRFIISRSVLKFILAAHTNLDARNITLDYYPNKKPYLASHPWLCFNVSHSGNIAVIAISRKEVGIDIEYISENFNFTNLLSTIFNDKEILAIKNAEDNKYAFYNSWTRKEAFVKALGKGIDDDFKNIPCLDGQHSLDFLLIGTTENWQIESFEIADKYVGSIAYVMENFSKNIEMIKVPNTMDGLLKLMKNQ